MTSIAAAVLALALVPAPVADPMLERFSILRSTAN